MEKIPTSRPALVESVPREPYPLRAELLADLLSNEPIHGLGHERLTDKEKAEVIDDIFNQESTPIENARGIVPDAFVMDLIECLKLDPNHEDRAVLKDKFKKMLKHFYTGHTIEQAETKADAEILEDEWEKLKKKAA